MSSALKRQIWHQLKLSLYKKICMGKFAGWQTFPHTWHLWGFAPVCRCWWLMRLPFCEKAFPRTWHWWGFSPVCRHLWLLTCLQTSNMLTIKYFRYVVVSGVIPMENVIHGPRPWSVTREKLRTSLTTRVGCLWHNRGFNIQQFSENQILFYARNSFSQCYERIVPFF